MKMKQALLSCSAVALLTGYASAAMAKQAVEEIVVTAQKRSENIQKVPIAVTAFSGRYLHTLGISDTSNLSQATPGLVFSKSTSDAMPFLRGVGTTAGGPNVESPVAFYIDGVYQSNETADAFSFNNIERIEVLKGPQGTLFGRNATGGVIQIITKDPTQTPHADISIGYANYNTTTLSAYVTGGVTKNLSTDLSIYGQDQEDGWGRNVTTGVPTDTGRNISFRNKWLLNVSDDTQVRLALNYSYSHDMLGSGWSVLPGSVGLDGHTRFVGFYNVSSDSNGQNDMNVSQNYAAALTLDHNFGWASFRSISSANRVSNRDILDADGTPAPISLVHISTDSDAFTQEFQLKSAPQSRLNWIVGTFFLHANARLDPDAVTGLSVGPGNTVDLTANETTNSYSAFGQATAEILPATHFTMGLRYTMEQKEISGNTAFDSFVLPGTAGSQAKDFDKLTWRFSLDHQFTPDILGYISDNRGFKSGLFNVTTPLLPPVAPEVLDAYEIGLKTELLGHRLKINSSAFYYQYRNIQVEHLEVGQQTLINGAAAEIYGLDLDMNAVPMDNLTIRGGFELMHGSYSNFPNAPSNLPTPGIGGNQNTVLINAAGLQAIHTPDISTTISADYRYPTTMGDFDVNLNYAYMDSFAWDPDNQVKQPRTNLINSSIGWVSPSAKWELSLWAKNLLGDEYYAYASAPTLGDIYSPAPPRTFGVTVTAHF